MQKIFGTESKAKKFYNKQMLDHLSPAMQKFITLQPMVFIATSDSKGECDCSFRAGSPGFVKVLSEKALVYPEYKGNGVWGSLGNISENPHIGMVFIDFLNTTVGLHVNGKARIVENGELDTLPGLLEATQKDLQNGDQPRPERWVHIEVEEAYIHCSRNIPLFQLMDKDQRVSCVPE